MEIILGELDLMEWTLERDKKKKNQQIHSSWPRRKQTSMLWTDPGSHMAKKSSSSAQKNRGTSVLQLQGETSSNDPNKLGRELWAPNDKGIVASALNASSWDPEQGIQLSRAQTPGHGEFEIINVLLLRLWQYCHTAMEIQTLSYISFYSYSNTDLCLSQCLKIMEPISESLNTLPVFTHLGST